MSADLQLFVRRDWDVETTTEAAQLKNEALAVSKMVRKVHSTASRDTAVEALAKLKGVLSLAEKARKALKAPVLKLEDAIDENKKTFIEAITKEFERVESLVHTWEDDERDKAARLVAAKQRDLQRLEASLPMPKTREEFAAQHQTLTDARQDLAAAAAPPPLAPGQSIKDSWDYEIISLDRLYLVYGARLVDLTPRRREILELINSPECPTEIIDGKSVPKLPGLKVHLDRTMKIKAAVPAAPIDVEASVTPEPVLQPPSGTTEAEYAPVDPGQVQTPAEDDGWIYTPESSQIVRFTYHPDQFILTVEFKGTRGLYHYHRVPETVFDSLKAAESRGSFLIKHIKGVFSFSKG